MSVITLQAVHRRGDPLALLADLESRDLHWIAEHCRRVGALAALIASRMGCSTKDVDVIRQAGALHDVGKMLVDRAMLHRPGPLDASEMREVQSHVHHGAQLVREAQFDERIARLVFEHHERENGEGYPSGTAAADLDPLQPILVVADVYDAIISPRVYSRGRSRESALRELNCHDHTLFAPEPIRALQSVLESAASERTTC